MSGQSEKCHPASKRLIRRKISPDNAHCSPEVPNHLCRSLGCSGDFISCKTNKIYIVYDNICRTDPHVRCLEVTCDMPVLVSDVVWSVLSVVSRRCCPVSGDMPVPARVVWSVCSKLTAWWCAILHRPTREIVLNSLFSVQLVATMKLNTKTLLVRFYWINVFFCIFQLQTDRLNGPGFYVQSYEYFRISLTHNDGTEVSHLRNSSSLWA